MLLAIFITQSIFVFFEEYLTLCRDRLGMEKKIDHYWKYSVAFVSRYQERENAPFFEPNTPVGV